MKPWIRPYICSLLIWIGTLLLFSIISSSLYTFNVISNNTYHLLNTIFPYISFACGGISFGIFVTKKVLLQALVMTFLLTLIAITLQENTAWLSLCLHSTLFLACTLFFPCVFKR